MTKFESPVQKHFFIIMHQSRDLGMHSTIILSRDLGMHSTIIFYFRCEEEGMTDEIYKLCTYERLDVSTKALAWPVGYEGTRPPAKSRDLGMHSTIIFRDEPYFTEQLSFSMHMEVNELYAFYLFRETKIKTIIKYLFRDGSRCTASPKYHDL
ncbi:hypothetical protein ACJX0J_041825 [Zea mays]